MSAEISSSSIANMALRHLAASRPISDVETDASQEAVACRTFYALCLEESLRDFAWPFTTRIETLGLVEEEPNDEWGYSYRYPSNCKMIRRILSGVRNDTRQSKISYRLIQDDQGILILTDQKDAECEFTVNEVNVQLFPPDLVMAISFLLASYIAPSITKSGDTAKLGEYALKRFSVWIEKARANALNEQQDDEEPESQFIRERGQA